jgi:ABC-type uncharacterized transport system permease subunit
MAARLRAPRKYTVRMILSSGPAATLAPVDGWSAMLAAALYGVATLRGDRAERLAAMALPVAWLVHLLALVLDISGWDSTGAGARLGFAPVLSLTVWIVIGLHAIESRFVPLPAVRGWLAPVGAVVVLLAAYFPGDLHTYSSPAAPLHFVLGVAAYGLFGAAVLHGAMLDAAERRMRLKVPARVGRGESSGMPLLQLERLTFRFVGLGFVVLTATLVLGLVTATQWRWDHKSVLSVLGWAVFAALLTGRRLRGWRGRKATRWLYAGAALLLLAYVGSRFVFEVLLNRPVS